MRLGITYLSISPSVDRASARQKYLEFGRQVEWANDKGFAGIWVTEHHFRARPGPRPSAPPEQSHQDPLIPARGHR